MARVRCWSGCDTIPPTLMMFRLSRDDVGLQQRALIPTNPITTAASQQDDILQALADDSDVDDDWNPAPEKEKE